jgi:hypothetical protein
LVTVNSCSTGVPVISSCIRMFFLEALLRTGAMSNHSNNATSIGRWNTNNARGKRIRRTFLGGNRSAYRRRFDRLIARSTRTILLETILAFAFLGRSCMLLYVEETGIWQKTWNSTGT